MHKVTVKLSVEEVEGEERGLFQRILRNCVSQIVSESEEIGYRQSYTLVPGVSGAGIRIGLRSKKNTVEEGAETSEDAPVISLETEKQVGNRGKTFSSGIT